MVFENFLSILYCLLGKAIIHQNTMVPKIKRKIKFGSTLVYKMNNR